MCYYSRTIVRSVWDKFKHGLRRSWGLFISRFGATYSPSYGDEAHHLLQGIVINVKTIHTSELFKTQLQELAERRP
jgi:hypothetical protein